ncbi:hypothetical protein Q8F55_004350 [Vanrija albida]|uniref:Uncharacterized protein n=1 Tax=Vanrija albida TaxID=181172 RepID=A0ABR3Q751_9TREE
MTQFNLVDIPINSLLKNEAAVKGSLVLITGGASGFGRLLAGQLAKAGASLFLVDLNEVALAALVAEIKGKGGSAASAPADVTSTDAQRSAFEACVKAFGRAPDIVYANAGVNGDDNFEEDDGGDAPQPWRDITYKINFRGMVITSALAQEFWAKSPAKAPRRLVFTASMGGVNGIPSGSCYAASKHATLGIWKGLADDLASGKLSGFTVHAMCPFFAATGILPAAVRFFLAGVPLVEVPTVSNALVYIAAGSNELGDDGAILIPDAGSPSILRAKDYDPLVQEFSDALDQRIAREKSNAAAGGWGQWFSDVSNIFNRTAAAA